MKEVRHLPGGPRRGSAWGWSSCRDPQLQGPRLAHPRLSSTPRLCKKNTTRPKHQVPSSSSSAPRRLPIALPPPPDHRPIYAPKLKAFRSLSCQPSTMSSVSTSIDCLPCDSSRPSYSSGGGGVGGGQRRRWRWWAAAAAAGGECARGCVGLWSGEFARAERADVRRTRIRPRGR